MVDLRKFLLSLILMVGLFFVFGEINKSYAATTANPKTLEKNLNDAISKKNWNNSAIYSKNLAVYYDERKEYQKAIKYYEMSAEYWSKAGHPSWGIQNLIRADHISTNVELYTETPIKLNKKLEKNEPASGMYLGLFLAGHLENGNPYKVKGVYGRNHALYLTYTKYGVKYKDTDSYFPVKFAREAKENGAGIQIGYEPLQGLDKVKDDEVLRQFAREAKASGVPVFLRFAGEMNGEWVPWHTTPEEYIKKFRLVHDVMEEEAPNVSMVWSPNFLPRHNIDAYYPGDKYVDWVGISLYTIPFSQGKEVPGGNPIDYLRPIYETYSHKPMMVSEGAVSHYSFQLKKDFSNWAVGQLGNMYGFMPRMFPQLKAMSYFNLDKSTTSYDNSNNNYDLGDSVQVLNSYKSLIQNDYFIDRLVLDEPKDTVKTQFVKYNNLVEAAGKTDVFTYVKLPLGQQPYYVAIYQGKTKLAESYKQPWDMKIDFSKVDSKKPLTIIAFDKNFKRLATKEVSSKFKKVSQLGSFTDVKEGYWAFKDVENALATGIVKGYEDGSFRPNNKITVAEFITMLGKKFGLTEQFVKEGYPNGALNLMKQNNYPYSNSPSKQLTRLEVAEIIVGTQGFHYVGDDAIKYLLLNEMSKGRDPKNISVKGYDGISSLTRAEAIKFIENIYSVAGSKELQVRPTEKSDTEALNNAYNEKFKDSN